MPAKKEAGAASFLLQISLLDIKQERKVQQMITTETESSSVIHGKSQIPGYHLSHFLFRISDRIRTPHAEKTHSTDGIPVACYRNQYLLRVCVLLCHRIIDAVLRDKNPGQRAASPFLYSAASPDTSYSPARKPQSPDPDRRYKTAFRMSSPPPQPADAHWSKSPRSANIFSK